MFHNSFFNPHVLIRINNALIVVAYWPAGTYPPRKNNQVSYISKCMFLLILSSSEIMVSVLTIPSMRWILS